MPGRLQAHKTPHLGPKRPVGAVGKEGCDSGVQASKIGCTAQHPSARPKRGAGVAVHVAKVTRGLFLRNILEADTCNIPSALHDVGMWPT